MDDLVRTMEFRLSKVPELFFDRLLWDLFASYFDSAQFALERIGYPPGPTGYHSELHDLRGSLSAEQWKNIEESSALGREILRNLQNKLLTGELFATGVPRGYWNPEREKIPVSEWRELWPNFIGDWAMSTKGSYDDIQLTWHPLTGKEELQNDLVAFLQQQASDGVRERKVLLYEANRYFAQAIPTRVFAGAYQTVFKSHRGRPRKSK